MTFLLRKIIFGVIFKILNIAVKCQRKITTNIWKETEEINLDICKNKYR